MGVWSDFWKNRSLSNVIPNLKKTGKTISTEAGHLKDAFAEEASDMYNYGIFDNVIMDVAEEFEGVPKNEDILHDAYKQTFDDYGEEASLLQDAYVETIDDIGANISDAYDEDGLLGAVEEVVKTLL